MYYLQLLALVVVIFSKAVALMLQCLCLITFVFVFVLCIMYIMEKLLKKIIRKIRTFFNKLEK